MQCKWDIDVFLVLEANSDVARRVCVVQGQDGFSSKIEIISHDVKVLKSEPWKILSQFIPVSCFYKLPIDIQEAFSEWNFDELKWEIN